jgi:ribonuclease E
LVIRAIRDYFNHDIGDILIDTDDIYDQAHQFMAHVMPEHAARVKRYRDETPLFSRFQIEHQIESAYARTVNLPSGGAIVIDHTEALVSVDVNSARAIKGGDIEETATRTNLEAADEVARQMRLRDLGGLIVIDFIDMEESRNRREVENRLRDALRLDRARVQFGTISKFGLMEMSRQRLRPALSEGASIPCPRCGGSGHVRDTESSALQILRIIQEEAMKDNTAAVHAQVPVEVASFLLNEKRTEIAKIEIQQRLSVLLVPNKTLETPNYKLERLKHDDPRLDKIEASYKMAEEFEDPTAVTRRSQEPTNKQTPVIKGVLPDLPAPIVEPKPAATPKSKAADKARPAKQEKAEKGFFAWLKGLFGSDSAEENPATGKKAGDKKDDKREPREGREGRDGRGRGGRGGRGARHGERGSERNGADKGEGRNTERNENAQGRGPRQERSRGNRGNATSGNAANGNAINGDAQSARSSTDETQTNKSPEAQAEARANARHDRMAREERGEQPRRERTPRGENRRGDRPRHEDAESSSDVATLADNAAADTSHQERADDNTGERRERRSRDRYGRDRRERGSERHAEPSGERHAERSDNAADHGNGFNAAPLTSANASTAPAARASMPRVASFTLSVPDLEAIAQSSGLEWVNSNAERIAAVQAAIAAEPKPVHIPRERPAPVVIDEGPLVLVETRKDL